MSRITLAATGVLLLLCIAWSAQPGGDASAYQIDSTINLSYRLHAPNNESQMEPWTEAEVGPGFAGVVKFDGQLTLVKWPSEKLKVVLVQMTAHLEDVEGLVYEEPTGASWGTSVFPPSLEFNPNEFMGAGRNGVTKSFSLFARAPLRIDADAAKRVVVTGTWMGVPSAGAISEGDLTTASIAMEVAQYYDVYVDSVDPFKTIWPGEQVTFTVIVNNRGNGEDDFGISLEDEAVLQRREWGVFIEKNIITVPAHSSGKFTVTAKAPERIISGYRSEVMDIGLRVESKGARTANDVEYEVYYLVVHEQGFNIDPEPVVAIVGLIILLMFLLIRRSKAKKRRIEALKIKRRLRRDPVSGKWKKRKKSGPWYSASNLMGPDEKDEALGPGGRRRGDDGTGG